MLTRNDTCFFAIAFYRQTRQEVMRAYERQDYAQVLILGAQAQYWWDLYTSRRKESRINSIQSSLGLPQVTHVSTRTHVSGSVVG